MGKVLVVEDDNNLREIFEMRLQAEGYDTLSAEDGEKALDIATREKPDLLIADIMMPKLSGFEMLENLRAVPGDYHPKVIIMTALGQDEDQARGQKLGVVKYLVKSQVTLEDFVRVVREVMPPGKSAAPTSEPSEDKAKASTTINKQESEKSMDDNTNPTPPAGGDMPTGDTGQMGASDEKKMVDDQANAAMGSAPAGGDAPASGDGSMSGGGMTPPASDAPTTPPAEPTEPKGDETPGGPATPPPAGGM
jgi:CheY-like chemotaxis protein